jgi:hypothetical protein
MENRISAFYDEFHERPHDDGPRPIGEILAELLAQYQVHHPEVRITVVETPVTV